MNDFPTQEAHSDRLFKHITFPGSEKNSIFRLTPVYHDDQQANTIIQKEVNTNIAVDSSSDVLFRIKAVLKESNHGVKESHWVTTHKGKTFQAKPVNHYRVRGVSKQNLKSDWVYSEIKDQNNDLIIYNMIYDLLDIMLSIQEEHIDYLLDHALTEVFKEVIYDSSKGEENPIFEKLYEWVENKEFNLSENIRYIASSSSLRLKEEKLSEFCESYLAFANRLKHDFKESINSSPEEFVEFYRLYSVLDRYQEEKIDFLSLLLEVFLEEHYGDLVETSNMQVIIQNDEQKGVYLNTDYSFDIKSELIRSVSNFWPTDHFVTILNDAVQLITEPIVYEELAIKKNEELERLVRTALTDLFLPMAILRKDLEVNIDLLDVSDYNPTERLIEYSMEGEEGNLLRYMLVYDILESMIKNDDELNKSANAEFIEKFLEKAVDKNLGLFIGYYLEEAIEIFSNIIENFHMNWKQASHVNNEYKVTQIRDLYQTDETKKKRYQHEIKVIQDEWINVLDTIRTKQRDENISVRFMDLIIKEYGKFKRAILEQMPTKFKDQYNFLEKVKGISKEDSYKFRTEDQAQIQQTSNYTISEEIKSTQTEGYYNLFIFYLKHPNAFPYLEHKELQVNQDLYDYFTLDVDEKVQYALGWTQDGWPLGIFKLGENTLSGEVSINE